MEKRGRFIAYDKQRVLEEIVSGDFSAKSIAERHGITRDMVYTLKYQAKRRNLIQDPTQKLDDLDPVEQRTKGILLPNKLLELARKFKEGKIDDFGFLKEARRLV